MNRVLDWCFLLSNKTIVAIVGSILLLACSCIIYRYFGGYRYAEKHGIVWTIALLFLFVFFCYFDGLSHISNRDTIWGIIDSIISNYVVLILVFGAWRIERCIKNKYEDINKLSEDYSLLVEKYPNNKGELIKCVNDDGSEVLYPVICIGHARINVYNSTDKYVLDEIDIYDSDYIYSLPLVIESNFTRIMAVHSTSSKYNALCVRVKDMIINNNRLSIRTERTKYYYSLITNRAADYNWDDLSIRDLYEPGPSITSLNKSEMSNHLGFNGFIESSDGAIAFIGRSSKVTIAKNTYADSIGASLKSKYALDKNGIFTSSGLINAFIRELEDELGIEDNDILTEMVNEPKINKYIERIDIIGAYRDIVEVGKPQLLFYAKMNLHSRCITKMFCKDGKGNNLTRTEAEMQKDGKKIFWINSDSIRDGFVTYVENGIYIPAKAMFVYAKKDRKFNRKRQFWKMVPSASATIKLLQDYLLK